jgi:hypothetical protein
VEKRYRPKKGKSFLWKDVSSWELISLLFGGLQTVQNRVSKKYFTFVHECRSERKLPGRRLCGTLDVEVIVADNLHPTI